MRPRSDRFGANRTCPRRHRVAQSTRAWRHPILRCRARTGPVTAHRARDPQDAPPFGIAFAAWDTADEQQAWIRRGAADDEGLRERLRTVLTRTRERGYDVDWMTPTSSQAAQAIGTLSGDSIPPHNPRSVIHQLRVEFASADPMPDDTSRGAHPVATISAPVLDADDRIALVLAIHPLRAMTIREIRAAAKPLLREVSHVRNF